MADTQTRRRLRHLKRGTTYVEIGRGLVQCDTSLADMADVIVYRGESDDSLWVRPPDEFDGRFEELPAQPVASISVLSNACADVIAERRRQVEAEGWTPEHDDREHWLGDLALAASVYARYGVGDVVIRSRHPAGRPPKKWPWADEWWKPSTPRRDLVKAAALLLAEIERIDREAARRPTADRPLPTAVAP